MTTASALVRAAYAETLGDPVFDIQLGREPVPVSVLKYGPGPATGGVAVYLTAGVSDLPPPGAPEAHRLEFHLGLLPEVDQAAMSLAWLGAFAQRTGKATAPGHTWRSDAPVIPGFGFTGFLVLQSNEPVVPPILRDDLQVRFLTAVPVFTDELDYLGAHGHKALWERMEEAAVPAWNPGRTSTFAGAGRRPGQA